jgi:hypothetical protein
MKMRKLLPLIAISILGIFAVECNKSSDEMLLLLPPKGKTYSTPAGAVKFKMTDFPLNNEEISGVLIDIRKVSIHTPDEGWVDVVDYGTTGKRIDLLELQNGKTEEIGFFQLGVGTYEQIRLYLNDNNHIVVRGADGLLSERPLKVPSGLQTGIKLVRSFTVSENGVTELLVDFDAQQSIIHNKGQGYILKPTIKVIGVSTTPGASRLIKAAKGGTVEIANSVSITIPPGALASDTVISIVPADESVENTAGVSRSFNLSNYNFLPENVPLISDASVTMHYDPTILTELNRVSGSDSLHEAMLDIQFFDPTAGHYVSAGRVLDTQNNTVTAQTRHFSAWGLALNFAPLLLLVEPAITAATWELRANELLRLGQDWNTTTMPANYTYTYISEAALVTDPSATGKARYNSDVQNAWTTYENNYYPGFPMDPVLFVISQTVEVPGYASLPVISIFKEITTFASYVFFHAAQGHDLCDGRGYGTYHKDYSICNQEFYEDMTATCNKFASPSILRDRCLMAREHLKEGVDIHLRLKINGEFGGIYGNGCDDYDGVYAAPQNDLSIPSDPNSPKNRKKYCSGGLDKAKLLTDLGLSFPANVTPGVPDKLCGGQGGIPLFGQPAIKLTWSNPPKDPNTIAQWVNVYRVDMAGGDAFSIWADSIWNLLGRLLLGEVFYMPSEIGADFTVPYPGSSVKDQFDITSGNYWYSIKTVTRVQTTTGQTVDMYSEDLTFAGGVKGPVQVIYGSREIVNVCLASTHKSYTYATNGQLGIVQAIEY